MEISTFEILTKPIAPVVPAFPGINAVARRVIQGYFLTISNLESIDLRYRIEFTVSLPVPADPNKILAGNAQLLIDVEGNNVPVSLTQKPGNPKVYRGYFIIPAHKTASVELLPILPKALTPGLLEVRGYVSLFLPPKGAFGKSKPQSNRPVKVLLNPEIRGTFLPNDFPTVMTNLDFDQISYTLAIASGQALNSIPPEPGFPLVIDLPVITPILEDLQNGTLDLSSLEADNFEKAQMLLQLLADLDPNEENLNALNTVMDKLNLPIKMSRG